jgi:hypothetical protein
MVLARLLAGVAPGIQQFIVDQRYLMQFSARLKCSEEVLSLSLHRSGVLPCCSLTSRALSYFIFNVSR